MVGESLKTPHQYPAAKPEETDGRLGDRGMPDRTVS